MLRFPIFSQKQMAPKGFLNCKEDIQMQNLQNLS